MTVAGFVDNGQTSKRQGNSQIWIDIIPGVIGTTMLQLLRHLAYKVICMRRKIPA